jgi:hypothetical protein
MLRYKGQSKAVNRRIGQQYNGQRERKIEKNTTQKTKDLQNT